MPAKPPKPPKAPKAALTLTRAMELYLQHVDERSSSATHQHHTQRAYAYALKKFLEVVARVEGQEPGTILVTDADPDWVDPYLDWLKQTRCALSTEQLRLAAVRGFYHYLGGVQGVELNTSRVDSVIRNRRRRGHAPLIHFRTEDVEAVLEWAAQRVVARHRSRAEKLRALRDYAFLLLLADTGLRVAEACALSVAHLPHGNVLRPKIMLRIKGGRESVVRLSPRAWRALRAYLHHRRALDEASGLPPERRPLFAQHSPLTEVRLKKARGKAAPPLRRWEPAGAQAMLRGANEELFGDEPHRKGERRPVTPHSLRHYFVTMVLRKSGGNLKLAQELARHRSIAVTQRYAHLADAEVDDAYEDLFGEQEG
jgi:integrase/recombinase XerC